MDPHANVVEADCLAREILRRAAGDDGSHALTNDAMRLAELVVAQHEWRTNGGFDPYADPQAPQANPQANALLERCRRNRASTVWMDPDGGSPGWALPDGYVYVVEAALRKGHAFECGIAPDGRVSS